MMTTATHGLDVLTECLETNSKTSRDHTDDTFNYPRYDEGISIDSDYTSGTTDDGIIMPDNYNNNDVKDKKEDYISIEGTNSINDNVQPAKSDMPLEERALCSHLSIGTFSKRLQVNNFAASPKSSIQRLFLLQSGDAGSLVIKPSVSQTDKLLKLKRMPVLSKTQWNLRFPTIPMHITTVGYAFPAYKSDPPGLPAPNQLVKVTKDSDKATLVCHNGVNNSLTADEVNSDQQHNKNKQLHSLLEKAVQDDALNLAANIRTNKTLQTVHYYNNDISKSVSIQALTDDGEAQTNRIDTKITQTIVLEDKCTSDTSKNPDEIECTTSLDILVGLLNEIQKITTCQTHITNNESDDGKELEMLLNKAAALENSIGSTTYNNVSITSLDKLRCLDSNPSLYSFYISDTDDKNVRANNKPNIDPWYETKNSTFHTTICADKEVSVDIVDKECVHALTDVPSVFLPITISHSTNMTNTLVEEFCQSSLQTMLFTDYQTTYSNTLSVKSTQSDDSSKKIIELLPQNKHAHMNQISQIRQEQKITKVHKRETGLVKEVAKTNMAVPKSDYCLKSSDFDPVMKLKRDILVTVYSMLVLTVFAALSFPEVLYHVM